MTDISQTSRLPDTSKNPWVSDAELYRLLGVPEKYARVAIAALDRDRRSGFPKPHPMMNGRRHWQDVRDWFDGVYGLDAPPQPLRPKPTQYVYFARCGDLVKIGTSKNPKSRIPEMQVGNPHPVTLLAAVVGGRDLEKEFHRRFASVRVRGEWFQAAPELLAYIESIEK